MTPADVVVVKGNPDDEEIAALIAVLTAIRAKAAERSPSGRESLWANGPGRPAFRPPGAWTPLRSRRAA